MFDDVLCLSHLRWGFVFQRPNHLMSRCARQRRVFFVEEPHFDVDTPRMDTERVEGDLHVVVPHLPPGTSGDEADRLQQGLLVRLVDRARIQRPLLWLYTPMAVPMARGLNAAGWVYDCMDELSHFKGAPAELRERERTSCSRRPISSSPEAGACTRRSALDIPASTPFRAASTSRISRRHGCRFRTRWTKPRSRGRASGSSA
jgi:hypothetical protein